MNLPAGRQLSRPIADEPLPTISSAANWLTLMSVGLLRDTQRRPPPAARRPELLGGSHASRVAPASGAAADTFQENVTVLW